MSKPQVDRAVIKFVTPATAEKMVVKGNDLLAKVGASPNAADAKKVTEAATEFATANTDLNNNNKAKGKAKTDLQTAETNEGPMMRRWTALAHGLLNAIEVYADGSKEVAQSFNVPLVDKQAKPQATTPEELRPMKERKHHCAGWRWAPTDGAHGYMIQHCTNPSDPATYSEAIASSAARFWLDGQTPGATVYLRVLACDTTLPNGQTAYTTWVAAIAA